MPIFVKIGQSVVKILSFFFHFSSWQPPPSWIFETAKFYWIFGSRTDGGVASVCKILSESVNRLQRY